MLVGSSVSSPQKSQPQSFLGSVGRHNVWLWIAALALVLGAAFNAFTTMSADTDLWGHLRFGEAHWESGQLERSDPYSFTSGEVWINHEWLSELVFFAGYKIGGDFGLLVLKLILGLTTMFLLVGTSVRRGASPLVIAVVLPLAAFGLTPGFMFRPQVFSFVLFAVTLALIRVDLPVGRRAVLALPLVVALWVNLHGGFLIGCAVVAAVVLSESVVTGARGLSKGDLRWIWAGAIGAAIATLLNPYGIELLRFLFRSLSLPRPIGEWDPLPPFDSSFPEIKVMLALALAIGIWLGWRRELRVAEGAVLLLTIFATLKHQRHAPFFLIAAAPLVADGLSRLTRGASEKLERSVISALPKRIAILGLLLIAVLEVIAAAHTLSATRARIYVDPELYPVQATDFLLKNGATGRLLLPFEWGEYAIWHLFPSCQVSIDGRFRTVYPENVLIDHYLAAVEPARWELLMATYQPDLAMIPRSPAVDEFARRGIQGWTTVHVDPLAVVLVRTGGASSAIDDTARRRSLVPADHPPRVVFP